MNDNTPTPQAAHTPLPWTVQPAEQSANKIPKIIVDGKPGFIASLGFPHEGKREANGALIVRAVNSHADMLAALNNCDRAFVSWQLGHIPGRPEDILVLIGQVRAAIAKAEESP